MVDGPVDATPRREKHGPPRDHTPIGTVARPDFVRLPHPATIFAARARRFAELAAADQPLAPYLRFLSHLADVQHRTQAMMPTVTRQAPGALRLHDLLSAGGLADRIAWFAQRAAMADAPAAAEQARAGLAAMPAMERLALAGAVLDGTYLPDRLGESLYVAAALQVHLTRLASRLAAGSLAPGGDGDCPACGSRPVASMIVGWAGANRTRYCCCSLCGTLWHVVRARCTSCASTAGISYVTFEEQSIDIAAETCSVCNRYIKHLRQDRAPEIDPVADDIASLGLDLRLQAMGIRRAAPNPLMVVH
nr:formate dehydrogenase accessory protein FdhE [uncultured Rhodopila sp.]